MQNPTEKTPIPRCIHLGTYSARMLGKFPNVPEHVAQTAKMSAITGALEQASDVYEKSKLTIIEARVDVKFVDLTSDKEIENLIRRVQLADSAAKGPIFKVVAPEGKTPLVKPFGQTQLDVLKDLHGVLTNLLPTWSGAAQEVTLVADLCKRYKEALDAREAAWQNARNLRKARNLVKQAFLKGYLEISHEVKALYPLDKKMQDLFFDVVDNDAEKDLGEDPAPPDGGPSGTPT